jgi:hypothetical protein
VTLEPSTSAMFQIPVRHRGLCGKACYGSRGAAERQVKSMKRSGKARPYQGYLHAYVCKVCRAWHVGHTEYEEE